MKVILKDNIENLGRKGDIVEIAPGYGRNYLIPKKLALEVSLSNMKMIEMEQQALKKRLEKEVSSYQELIQQLNKTTLSFVRKAGEKDIIFGSVSSSDVKEALDKVGFEIDKKKILLIEPIKRLGNFTVAIKVYHEQQAEVKIEVIKEKEEGKEKKKVEEENVLEEKKEVIDSEEKKEKEK